MIQLCFVILSKYVYINYVVGTYNNVDKHYYAKKKMTQRYKYREINFYYYK